MQWHYLGPDQSGLARFVLECAKSPLLDDVISGAGDELDTLSADPVFDGYSTADPSKVHAQVEAVYLALHKHRPKLRWTVEPRDRFVRELEQIVRTPDEVIQQEAASCIDIVSLFCSLLIKKLNPLIAVVGPAGRREPTHAILGYWLEDRTFSQTTVPWRDVVPYLDKLAFVEATGVLEGNKRPFADACAQSLESLPRDVRPRIALPADAMARSGPLLSAAEARVLYVIDVRRMLDSIIEHIPVIAVMGAKGGVGKTSVCARMAELVAETKHNVLIIDVDLESAGSTIFHCERERTRSFPPVKTVYDHLLPFSAGSEAKRSQFDDGLWRVTPSYLEQKHLGDVYLLPARQLRATGGWEVVANIDPNKRNEILRSEVSNIVGRAQACEREISCIIIDCGAGVNPIFSAAFDRADYAYIIATPDPVCFTNIHDIDQEHRSRFPDMNIRQHHVIVNRVTSDADKDRWAALAPAGFISDDPTFQKNYFTGSVDFDVGYDDFSLAVRNCLGRVLHGADRSLVPDEIDVFIKPWYEQVVNRRLPERMLSNWRFRAATVLSWVLPVIFCLAALFGGYSSLRMTAQSQTAQNVKIAVIQADSRDEALALLARIQHGADFSLMARDYSTDSATRDNGGRIGEAIQVGDLVPGVGELAGLGSWLKTAEPGSVSGDVFTANSRFYVVRALEKLPVPASAMVLAWRFLVNIGSLLALAGAALTLVLLVSRERRRRLLLQVAKRGTDKEFIRSLLERSRQNDAKGALKWLHGVFEEEIKEDRQKLRYDRYGESPPEEEGKHANVVRYALRSQTVSLESRRKQPRKGKFSASDKNDRPDVR